VRHGTVVSSVASVALAALPGAGAPAGVASSHTVRIKDIEFHPRTTAVNRGDSVRWVWLDGPAPHNVTSRGAVRFRSSPTKTQDTFTVRFRRAGSYRYACTIHFNMKGKVVVR
jgi:plastocyanin